MFTELCCYTTKHEHFALGIQKENVLLKHKHIVSHGCLRAQVKTTTSEELGTDASVPNMKCKKH